MNKKIEINAESKMFLASTIKRVLARSFDLLFFGTIIIICFFASGSLFSGQEVWHIMFVNFCSLVFFIIYFVLIPYFFSYQTLGKKIFGIVLLFTKKHSHVKMVFLLLFRELYIVCTPILLVWMLYGCYFLLAYLLGFAFNSVNFLGRSSILLIVWWFFYFIFVKINTNKQIFYDRWFSLFVVDNNINFIETKLMSKSESKKTHHFKEKIAQGSFVSLNKEQKKVVTLPCNYNLRVVAGPGTGKTTVLTEKIIFMIKHHKIYSQQILTLTFTRKACQNIQTKVVKLLNLSQRTNLPIFTYHGFGYYFLQREFKLLGWKKHKTLSVLDRSDQSRLIKSWLLKEKVKQRIDAELIKNILVIIDNLQQNLIFHQSEWEKFQKKSELLKELSHQQKTFIWHFYLRYDTYKKHEGFLDFNDLLLKTYQILQQNKLVLSKWQQKFRYLLIDEFQDTNALQFDLIKLLTAGGKKITTMVVGDPDQTIYAWRGADVNFIINFANFFNNVKTLKLIVNYRSKANIIALANHLIENNELRVNKKLVSTKPEGDDIIIYSAGGLLQQVKFIINKIQQLQQSAISLDQIVILYRVNSISGLLEKALMEENIPYQIFKGLEFFKRKEIKELLTLLAILNQPRNIYWNKILSWISGIGLKTIESLEQTANSLNLTVFEYLNANGIPPFLIRFEERIKFFLTIFNSLLDKITQNPQLSLKVIIQELFTKIYQPFLAQNIDYEIRQKNVDTLINQVIVSFEEKNTHLSAADKIHEFLLQTHLSAADDLSKTQKKVSLMTIHNAKGLEFPYVFIFDVSHTNFPNINREVIDLEEERRLLFVAITRAQNDLFITTNKYSESLFIDELRDSGEVDYLQD